MDIIEYDGVIVEESLRNTDVLKGMKVVNSRATDDSGGITWHIHKVKAFWIDYADKTTWRDAVEYGLSQGIPEAQLDFARE